MTCRLITQNVIGCYCCFRSDLKKKKKNYNKNILFSVFYFFLAGNNVVAEDQELVC